MNEVGLNLGVSRAHLEVAKTYSSPLLMGPRMCDELMALVEHMLTDEEADVMRHMKPFRPRTAAGLAKASGRTLEEIKPILHGLAHEKYILASVGEGRREVFSLLPIIPGTFESVLVRISPDSATPWHARFAELFEALYETGFVTEYLKKPTEGVRYLPVGESIENQPMALPSDRLEEILERYDDFAVGVCQCRLSKQLVGDGCGKMLETCTVMGDWAPVLVRQGRMREVSRRDLLEIKREAEKQGLVTWMMNEESGKFTSCTCSCCGCCCGALRTVSEFNVPGFFAPPHFMPSIDRAGCNLCGKCAKVCPMKALVMLGEEDSKLLVHKSERCIGCGLCAVACSTRTLTMSALPDYRKPPRGWLSHLARYAPSYLSNYRHVRSERRSHA